MSSKAAKFLRSIVCDSVKIAALRSGCDNHVPWNAIGV